MLTLEEQILNQIEINKKKILEFEKNNDYLIASTYAEQILFDYQKINSLTKGKHSNELNIAKSKLQEINKNALKNFKEVQSEVTLTNEEFEEGFLKNFKEAKNGKDVFVAMAKLLHVNESELMKTAKLTMPVTLQFVSLNVLDSDGNPVKGGKDGELWRKKKMYHINIGLRKNVLVSIFNRLIENGKLDYDNLIGIINEKPLFSSQSNFDKFQQGCRRFYLGDNISALHILVPTLEETIMNLIDKVGINTIGGRPTKGQYLIGTKTLGTDILLSKEFTDIFGPNFAQLINFILYDDFGLKIRHDIAHGNISSSECNSENVLLIICLFIYFWCKIKQIK